MRGLTEQVVASAVAGETGALHRVYEILAPALVGYLRSRGSDDPEGLTQDVFVALLPRLGKLRGGVSGLRTLAFSIAHARLVDETRRRSKRPPALPLDQDDATLVAASAEEHAMTSMNSAALIALLSELSPDQRNVVALRVIAQLSLEETAEVVGKSVGSVKQLQRRGLLALRERILARQDVTP